jgi:hypothetical protein
MPTLIPISKGAEDYIYEYVTLGMGVEMPEYERLWIRSEKEFYDVLSP